MNEEASQNEWHATERAMLSKIALENLVRAQIDSISRVQLNPQQHPEFMEAFRTGIPNEKDRPAFIDDAPNPMTLAWVSEKLLSNELIQIHFYSGYNHEIIGADVGTYPRTKLPPYNGYYYQEQDVDELRPSVFTRTSLLLTSVEEGNTRIVSITRNTPPTNSYNLYYSKDGIKKELKNSASQEDFTFLARNITHAQGSGYSGSTRYVTDYLFTVKSGEPLMCRIVESSYS